MKTKSNDSHTNEPAIAVEPVLAAGLFQSNIETRYAKDTGLECPKCGEHRMARHLLHGKRFCWAGCGWIDEPPCR